MPSDHGSDCRYKKEAEALRTQLERVNEQLRAVMMVCDSAAFIQKSRTGHGRMLGQPDIGDKSEVSTTAQLRSVS